MKWGIIMMIWPVIAGLIVVFDQLTKHWISQGFLVGESKPIIPGVFQLTHIKNTGASWGMFSGARIAFILLTFLFLAALLIWYIRKRPTNRLLLLALSLITGGAIGNLIDRMIAGQVTDFLDFCLIHFPVFNVADIAITVGAILLFIYLLFHSENQNEAK